MTSHLHIRLALSLLLTALFLSLDSCSQDNDDPVTITSNLGQAEISYGPDGIWDYVSSNRDFAINYLHFSHAGEAGTNGLQWTGFTPVRWAGLDFDKVADWATQPFQISTKGGPAGVGTPYIVARWNTQENASTPSDTRSCRVTYRKDSNSSPLPFSPQNVKVQLALKTLSALAPDAWLQLTAHGVGCDGEERTADIYLARLQADGPLRLTDWADFDLTSLGEVKELFFTLSSSQMGEWGLSVPPYFALSDLQVKALLPD